MEMSQRLKGEAAWRTFLSLAAVRPRIRRWTPHLVVACTAICLGVVALALGHLTSFYSVDGDIKYLGALSIAHHFSNSSIAYPSSALDPTGHYSLPLTAWYSGHDYAGYSLPFLYIAAVGLALFGTAGLILPPILGAVILLYAQMCLAHLLDLRINRIVLALVTIAATPLLFYAVSFWEHSLGVGLWLAGLALLLSSVQARTRQLPMALGAGAVFASGVLMRRDTLVPALVALVLLPLFIRRREMILSCLAAGVCLVLPIGAILLLHPEPLAVGLTHASPGRAAIGIRSGLTTLSKLEFLLTGGIATAAVIALAIILVVLRFRKPALVTPILAVGSILTGIGLVVATLTSYTFSNENILAFCPFAMWGVMAPLTMTASLKTSTITSAVSRWFRELWVALLSVLHRPTGEQPLPAITPANLTPAIWTIAVVATLGVVEAASDSGGAQWGPRYLLFAFPLLALLAMKARQNMLESRPGRTRVVNYSFALVLAVSILLQCLGLFALHVKQDLAAQTDQAIARTHTHLVVSAFPVIDVLAPTYESNDYLYAPTQSDLVTLMRRLRADGHTRLVMLCDTVDRCTWTGYAGWRHARVHTVKDIAKFAVFTTN
jgi:hypothetical protein